MLTRFIKIQLVLFTILTIIALVALGWYYLRLPSLVGVGHYELHADLPRSGGLYATANVTYRGTQIGKVTEVEPTETGAEADDEHRQPLQDPDRRGAPTCTPCRRSVSSTWTWCRRATRASTSRTVRPSRRWASCPARSVRRWTRPTAAWPCCPRRRSTQLLTETSQAVGGLGPALQRLVDSTTNIAQGFKDNLPQVNDIIAHSTPILDSQVELRRRHRAVVAQPEHHRRPVRRAGRGAAQRAAAGRADAGSDDRACSAACATRCRRRWRTWRSSSTCSSAITRVSSRRW